MASQFGSQQWLIQRASLPPICGLITAFEAEIECVRIVLLVGSALPGAALAGVFDDAGAFGDELRGVNAATVHAGLANIDPSDWPSRFGFLRHNDFSKERLTAEGRVRKAEAEETEERNLEMGIQKAADFGDWRGHLLSGVRVPVGEG
jgi:hypothetical protein